VLTSLASNEPLSLTSRCGGCRESLDMDLAIAELIAYHEQRRTSAPIEVPLDGRVARLRLPTGEDQARWARLASADARAATTAVLRDLAEDADRALLPLEIPPEWVEAAEEALAGADPLVDFRLLARCPECGAEQQIEIDLAAHALERLARAQEQLLDELHRLALAYHWSERELLSLSPRRRAQYLARLGAMGR
jgi:hypothetical protein